MLQVATIREDFPILQRKVNQMPLIYFDNAATSQTPQVVIDAIVDYYSNYNANIHRGVHVMRKQYFVGHMVAHADFTLALLFHRFHIGFYRCYVGVYMFS